MNGKRPDYDKNKSMLKKINVVSRGRRKPGMDGIKIMLIMAAMMAAVVMVFMYIGNLNLSQGTADIPENVDETPLPTQTPFVDEPIIPFVPPVIDEEMLFYPDEGGLLELPVNGATGWAAASSSLREAEGDNAALVTTLSPGQAFTILEEEGYWWRVRLPNGTMGWVDHRRCFINLPDVLPSIVYEVTNAGESVFRSSGFPLPNITGERLYSARAFNERLGRYEYIVPSMYPMAQALFNAQRIALDNSLTLVINEAFRPWVTQQDVARSMNQLLSQNQAANAAIVDSPWTVGWFIASETSGHQRGSSVDTSLANVREVEIRSTGDYSYKHVTSYRILNMGGAIHELSPTSAIMDYPTGISSSQILGGTVTLSRNVSPAVIRMQWFLASAGLRPLSSEWWHFDHIPSNNLALDAQINGNFFTESVYSEPPVR
jgi:D-alanyl-D-alanine dipeptidase